MIPTDQPSLRERVMDAMDTESVSVRVQNLIDLLEEYGHEQSAIAYHQGRQYGEINNRDALDRANALIRKLSREAMTAELAVERVRELTVTWEAKGLVPMGHYATQAVRAALDGEA